MQSGAGSSISLNERLSRRRHEARNDAFSGRSIGLHSRRATDQSGFHALPEDAGKLSVYDGDQISAAESCKHYTEVLRNASDSVWGVTCAEVAETGLISRTCAAGEFPSHALIDFTAHPERNFRKLAKKTEGLCHCPRLPVFAAVRSIKTR